MNPEPFMSAESEMLFPELPVDLDAEMDFLPEFCHYQDEGCELAPSCLECPFDICVEERLVRPAAATRNLRDAAMVKMHSENHISAANLARRFHIDRRTVYRILLAAQDQPGRFSLNFANFLIFLISSSLFIPELFDTLSDIVSF
jgi:hypothetical protein